MRDEKNNQEERSFKHKTKGLLGLFAICCIGVLAMAALGGVTAGSTDEFTKQVDVGGVTFYIPEGYSLMSSKYEDSIYSYMYTSGSSGISFIVTPDAPFTLDMFKQYQEDDGYITTDTVIGGYSGFKCSSLDSDIDTFYFEKDNAIIGVLITPDFDFETDIAKMI